MYVCITTCHVSSYGRYMYLHVEYIYMDDLSARGSTASRLLVWHFGHLLFYTHERNSYPIDVPLFLERHHIKQKKKP